MASHRLADTPTIYQHSRIVSRCLQEHGPQGAYETFGIPNWYGTGIDWNEFHTSTRYPNAAE